MHHRGRTPEQSFGQSTPSWSHLENTVPLHEFCRLENPIKNPFIPQPVLSKPFAGRMSCEAHVMRAMGSLCTRAEGAERNDEGVEIWRG